MRTMTEDATTSGSAGSPFSPPQGPPLAPPASTQPKPRGSAGRALWVFFGSLFFLAGLFWGTFNVVELIAHEERIERFSVPSTGITELVVDNSSGSVTIVGTDTDAIVVEAEVSDGVRSTGFSHEVVDSRLELRGSCPILGSMWCRVTWRVEVPSDIAMTVEADDDSVSVSGVDGPIVVSASNGSVELEAIGGRITVDADNGRVVGSGLTAAVTEVSTDNGRIELAFDEPPDAISADADNGRVEIAVPSVEGGYAVTTETSNGVADIDVVNNPESTRTIDVSTDNGSVTVGSVP